LFGLDIWREFLTSIAFSHQMLDMGLVPYFKLQSVFAAIRLIGGNLSLAYAAQTIVAVGAATTVAWIWRRPADTETKTAAVIAAIPLATPFVLDYDLTLLAPAIVLIVRKIARDGALPWETTIIGFATVLPLVSRSVAEYTDILLTPFSVTALLSVIAIRCRAESAPSPSRSAPSASQHSMSASQ
jgi:alpha-1,2-mannosyltransferase